MKKIIALALALIMALSMASVAFAAAATPAESVDGKAPGEKVIIVNDGTKADWKVSYDITSASLKHNGASMIKSIAWEKDADKNYDLVLTLKESLTSTDAKDIKDVITLTHKTNEGQTLEFAVSGKVGNTVKVVDGEKKAVNADDVSTKMEKNTVMHFEDNGGYVDFAYGNALAGTVKVEKGDKVQVYITDKAATDEDTVDAIDAYLGEDYEGIVEWYNFEGTGFGADVAFTYDAWEEDPHFFYAWDGEKFVDLEGKYNDDEDVEKYEFTAAAEGVIIVTDVEIVAAEEETKNPDTGANDVVGVAAALAVVSLVAAGAVSLKK